MMFNTSYHMLAGGYKHKPTIGLAKENYCTRMLTKSSVPSTDKVWVGTLEKHDVQKELCDKMAFSLTYKIYNQTELCSLIKKIEKVLSLSQTFNTFPTRTILSNT